MKTEGTDKLLSDSLEVLILIMIPISASITFFAKQMQYFWYNNKKRICGNFDLSLKFWF